MNYGLSHIGTAISFGKREKKVLQPSGQWKDFFPIYEPQAEKYETNGCTVWGTQNAIEMLIMKKFGIEPNYSERYTYNVAEIDTQGANPSRACEAIKEYGLVDALKLPIPATFNEFMTPRPMTPELLELGHKWLEQYTFDYNPLWRISRGQKWKIECIKKALKRSPVGVAVTAWFNQGDGVYNDGGGKPNNHWCVVVGYEERGWEVFDSYDHSTKVYDYNSRIDIAYEYVVDKRYYTDYSKGNPIVNTIKSVLRFLTLR